MHCLYQSEVIYVNYHLVRRIGMPVVNPEPRVSLGDRTTAASAARSFGMYEVLKREPLRWPGRCHGGENLVGG